MTTTVYACTHISKEIEEDSYEEGCIGQRTCLMDERCHVTAPTLPGLLKAIGKHMGLDIDDVFIPGDEKEGITHIGFNRLENADAFPPTDAEERLWKQGQLRLWLADYTFAVEKRTVQPLTAVDFETAGITTH